jgi:hypothetical protein
MLFFLIGLQNTKYLDQNKFPRYENTYFAMYIKMLENGKCKVCIKINFH